MLTPPFLELLISISHVNSATRLSSLAFLILSEAGLPLENQCQASSYPWSNRAPRHAHDIATKFRSSVQILCLRMIKQADCSDMSNSYHMLDIPTSPPLSSLRISHRPSPGAYSLRVTVCSLLTGRYWPRSRAFKVRERPLFGLQQPPTANPAHFESELRGDGCVRHTLIF